MEEKKIVISYIHELPYVANKRKDQTYMPKTNKKVCRRGISHHHNEYINNNADLTESGLII